MAKLLNHLLRPCDGDRLLLNHKMYVDKNVFSMTSVEEKRRRKRRTKILGSENLQSADAYALPLINCLIVTTPI